MCNALVWSVLGLYGLHGSEGCGFVAVYIKKEKRKKKVKKKKTLKLKKLVYESWSLCLVLARKEISMHVNFM